VTQFGRRGPWFRYSSEGLANNPPETSTVKRVSQLAAIALLAAASALSACGSANDEIVDQPSHQLDAGNDTSLFGGTAGFGGFGGTGGTGTGGVSGSASGTLGTGGSDGSGGSTPDGAAGGGTCNPAFCPNNGIGTPCCVVPGQGPCGFDIGNGCQNMPPNDF
jgi:hypothetical protein